MLLACRERKRQQRDPGGLGPLDCIAPWRSLEILTGNLEFNQLRSGICLRESLTAEDIRSSRTISNTLRLGLCLSPCRAYSFVQAVGIRFAGQPKLSVCFTVIE